MQLLTSTPLILLICLLIVLRGPIRGLPLYFAFLPMGMMAFVNLPAIGGMTVLAVDIGVVLLCLLLLFTPHIGRDLCRAYGPSGPGSVFLIFLVLSALSAVFLPRVFAGATEVFGVARVEGVQGIVSRPLQASNGNLSQLFRVLLSTLSFGAVAIIAMRMPDPKRIMIAIKTVTVVHIVMGVADLLTQALGLTVLLEWARTANYALTLGQNLGGLNRMIGGFPEASSFGYMSLGLFGFWLCYWFNTRGRDTQAALFCFASLVVVLRTTSSSAYAGLALLGFAFLAFQFLSLRRTRLRLRGATVLLLTLGALPFIALGAYTLYEVSPGFSAFIDRSIINKLDSDSGVERMSWNRQALTNFSDTWFFGAGLGSVRASNWVVSVLANTGIIGAVLMVWALASLFLQRLDGTGDDVRTLGLALKFACAGFLARALVVKASPDLGIAFFSMAGLVTGLALHARFCRNRTTKLSLKPSAPLALARRANRNPVAGE